MNGGSKLRYVTLKERSELLTSHNENKYDSQALENIKSELWQGFN